MNSSKTNELLKNIDSTLTTSNTTLTNIDTNGSNLNTISAGISITNTKLDTTNTELTSIKTDVSTIKTDVDTLAKKKIIFNDKLTDGTYGYLPKADYSSTPVDFYWSNNKGSPVYIYKYRFIYPASTEPTAEELYHSPSEPSNIGAMNSAGTDYEAPYVTMRSNKFYMFNHSSGAPKQNWISNTTFVFQNDFTEAPIEIGVSRKFGHHINLNINTSDYDNNPIGVVDGYFYSS